MSTPINAERSATQPRAVAGRIRGVCLRLGWDQKELARRSGVSRTTLYQIARGAVRQPRFSTLRKIAQALRMGVDELACGSVETGSRREELAGPASLPAFDRSTNHYVHAVYEDRPQLFAGWTRSEWDELFSTFGSGGQLTPEGVVYSARLINRKREVLRRLSIVLETHLCDVAVGLVNALFEMLQPEYADGLQPPATPDHSAPDTPATERSTGQPSPDP